MSIEFDCPTCGTSLKAPSKYAGRSANCKKCGNRIRIPEPVAESFLAENSEPHEDVEPRPSSQRNKSIEVACPNCTKRFTVDFHDEVPSGSTVVACDHCGVSKRLSVFQKELGRQIQTAELKVEQEKRRAAEELQVQLENFKQSKKAATPPPVIVEMEGSYENEVLGTIAVLIPFLCAALMWLWVRNISEHSLALKVFLTLVVAGVLSTSVLAAIEATLLGMGRRRQGRRDTGPIGWFLCHLLVWIIGFPAYLHARRRYHVRSLLAPGLLGACTFLVSGVLVGSFLDFGLDLEESARPLVTQIIHEQLNGDAQCKVALKNNLNNSI